MPYCDRVCINQNIPCQRRGHRFLLGNKFVTKCKFTTYCAYQIQLSELSLETIERIKKNGVPNAGKSKFMGKKKEVFSR